MRAFFRPGWEADNQREIPGASYRNRWFGWGAAGTDAGMGVDALVGDVAWSGRITIDLARDGLVARNRAE